MYPAGLAALNARDANATAPYSFEHGPKTLAPAFEKRFRANRKAWAFWERCPPYYRRVISFYVMSARRQETRERRFANVMRYSAKGQRLPMLAPAK